MQGDAGADPGFLNVEIDTHHFALAHSHKVVHQSWIAVVVRPNKHHPNFGLRFLAVDRRHKRRVIDFPLQNPFMWILQWSAIFCRVGSMSTP